MLNVSEIEKLIGIDGMRRVAQPLIAVSASSTSHAVSSGLEKTSATAYTTTMAPAMAALHTYMALREKGRVISLAACETAEHAVFLSAAAGGRLTRRACGSGR